MTSLIERTLGAAFERLPPRLQQFHSPQGSRPWHGVATITRGALLTRPAVYLGGFSGLSGTLPLTMTLAAAGEGEVWTRDFGGTVVTSTLRPGGPGLIAEKIGPLTLYLRPKVLEGTLHIPIVDARLGPLPLPYFPTGGGIETSTSEGITFDVDSHLPGLGRIIRYHGQLTPG